MMKVGEHDAKVNIGWPTDPGRGFPDGEPQTEAPLLSVCQRGASSGFCGIGAPARAQPVQLASLEVVTQSSSFIGRPQYVSLIPGFATCTLPSPLAWRTFISSLCNLRASVLTLILLFAVCEPSLTFFHWPYGGMND